MESGTTSKAALRLGLSQSAVSRSIASLEARLGRILFERDGGRLRPTSEATQLNRRLDPLFEALDRIDGPTEPAQETLRLTAPPTFAHRFLVGHIASFLRANPHYFISLEVASSEDVIRRIQEDRSDLGLSGVDLTREGIKLTPYRHSEAACAMPKGHDLAHLETVRPEDLHGYPLIGTQPQAFAACTIGKGFDQQSKHPAHSGGGIYILCCCRPRVDWGWSDRRKPLPGCSISLGPNRLSQVCFAD